jgi:phenylacetyl-CoA:acceptor oxidoreductase subunit 2
MNAARRQAHWDLRAAGNFIGGGTGCGLVLACALAVLLGAPLPRLALALGAVCIAAGLTLVWLEIGKPWRALHVFFHPQTSWMTREGILAGPLLAACALAWWFGQPWWLVLAAPLAAGFLYSQARILRAARAIPAWSNPSLVPLIIATGLAEGLGAFVALSALAAWAGDTAGAASLPLVLVALAALAAGAAREALRGRYRRALQTARAPQATLAWFGRAEVRVLQALRVASIALLAVGLALGLALGLSGPGRWALGALALGGLLAVAGGWGFKVVLITRAAYTRGAAIPHTPTRGRSQARSVVV